MPISLTYAAYKRHFVSEVSLIKWPFIYTATEKKREKKIWPKESGALIEYVFSLCKARNDFVFP